MPATDDDALLPFSLPSIHRKKVTAAFDGGLISSDGGVLLLAGVDKQLGLIDRLAALIPDPRAPNLLTHTMADILRPRVFAIACGYPDANDLDDLRQDPAFKLACGRLPETGVDLTSQPNESRWENAPDLRTLIRLSHGMVDLWCESYRRPPKAITLDIDDTPDVVHGHQQLSPIHVYDAASGHCVVTILRPGKTPGGKEVRPSPGHSTRLCLAEPLPVSPICAVWCAGYGGTGRAPSSPSAVTATTAGARPWIGARKMPSSTSSACPRTKPWTPWSSPRPTRCAPGARSATSTPCATSPRPATPPNPGLVPAVSWRAWHRSIAARGQAENLIKRHKSQLASDRTSCRSPLANQMRLILHTAAYWLMRSMQDAIPRPHPLAKGEFSTLRLRLLKVAVRIRETATRIRLAFAANCPDAALFQGLVNTLILRPS